MVPRTDASGFGPRRRRRALGDGLAVRFPSAAALLMRQVLRLPRGRARLAVLKWLLTRAYAAYDRSDAEVTFALLADDVEWHLPPGFPGAPDVLRGRDAVIRWYSEFSAEWDHRIRIDRIEDHGHGRVSVHAVNAAVSQATGMRFEVRDIDEICFERGRIALVRERLDDAEGSPWRGLESG